MTKREKPDEWMPLHIGKYLGDTARLNRDQHGAYLLLLMAYWMTGGALDDDDGELAAICKATQSEWKRLRPVMAKFFTVADGKWVQKRAEEELEKARRLVGAKSVAGKAGASARWQTHAFANASANGKPMADASLCQWQTDAPIPLPSNKALPPSGSVSGIPAIVRVCEALGVRLENDTSRLTWPAQLAAMLDDDLDLEADILPACKKAKDGGAAIKSLAYVRTIAERLRAERGALEAGQSERIWQERILWLKAYAGDARWRAERGIGPAPHEPNTLVTDDDLRLVPMALLMRERVYSGEFTPPAREVAA